MMAMCTRLQTGRRALVRLHEDSIEVTAMGWHFVRGVAMLFDRYLQGNRNRERFSRII